MPTTQGDGPNSAPQGRSVRSGHAGLPGGPRGHCTPRTAPGIGCPWLGQLVGLVWVCQMPCQVRFIDPELAPFQPGPVGSSRPPGRLGPGAADELVGSLAGGTRAAGASRRGRVPRSRSAARCPGAARARPRAARWCPLGNGPLRRARPRRAGAGEPAPTRRSGAPTRSAPARRAARWWLHRSPRSGTVCLSPASA